MATDRTAVHTDYAQRADSTAHPALGWFREARFGMFVHWGVYALPAGSWRGCPTRGTAEWVMHEFQIPAAEYRALAAEFDPRDFDADALVDLAVRAGQRYLVLTAKHHDGFCLWDSKLTDFTSASGTPFGRDIVGEVAAACGARGVRFGLYYSQTQDWSHPDAVGNDWDFDPAKRDFDGYLQHYVKPQLTELLTGYGPIGLIWFDTPQQISAEQSRDLVDHVHRLQPECLVNGRVGNGLGDYGQTRDNEMPDAAPGDWETPITGNETWGFSNRDENWRSAREVAETIAQAASKGGNVLLNVGPDPLGVVPAGQQAQLSEVGAWLDRCGEAIYGTARGPFPDLPWGWSTARGDRTYLHVRDRPDDGVLTLPAGAPVSAARMLTAGGRVSVPVHHDEAGRPHLRLREVTPDPVLSVIELETSPAGG